MSLLGFDLFAEDLRLLQDLVVQNEFEQVGLVLHAVVVGLECWTTEYQVRLV